MQNAELRAFALIPPDIGSVSCLGNLVDLQYFVLGDCTGDTAADILRLPQECSNSVGLGDMIMGQQSPVPGRNGMAQQPTLFDRSGTANENLARLRDSRIG